MKSLALAALFLVVATAQAARAEDLSVRGEITVDGDRVRLGDVIRGLRPEIADAFLCKAPSLGRTGTVSGSFIAARLRQEAGEELLVAVPEKVKITRTSQIVTAQSLQDAAEKHLKARHADESIEIRFPSKAKDLVVPPGTIEIFTPETAGDAPLGRCIVNLEIRVGEFRKTARLDAFVDRPQPVVVARRSIARGKTIAEDDIETRTVPARRARAGTLRQGDLAVGRVARNSIASGAAIDKTGLATQPLVRRGDILNIVVRTPGVELSAYGVAQSEAAQGESVEVKNLDTGAAVRARLEDAHTAVVEL